ncbi:hypothetical protein [Nonomuraea diastatica]|uniref:Uncharacterized protein n=1 Tax=Nonomuraea diastatica TaxID=1848329 RepID=A0A4R4X1I1_9ACTN|nr:hypothetical protein [Nonomuraea diastatica]TDD24054.1 hypothetical protein E1294_07350 [Nonomuraea diastatica]
MTSTDGRVPGWALWSLRVITLGVAVLVLVQPVLAGLFVTGDVGMLRTHSTMAGFLTVLVFVQFAAAILLWRPGRGPAWPIWAGLVFFLTVEAQSALGYARAVSVHIPLGVLLFGGAVAMVIATWSPGLRVRRSRPGGDGS